MSDNIYDLLEKLVEEVKGLREDFSSVTSAMYGIDDLHSAVEALGETIESQVDRLLGARGSNLGSDLGDLQRTLENVERSIDGLER